MNGFQISDKSTDNILPICIANPKGQNNCFLNSIIQTLMHLNSFREDFKNIRELYCLGNSCIFCAFEVLFTQSDYDNCIQPDALRNSMASAFSDQARFQLNSMEDAAECYECILDQLHYNLAKDVKNNDQCNYISCLVHRKFALFIQRKMETNCNCPNDYQILHLNPFVYYVTSDNMRTAYNELKIDIKDFDVCKSFGHVLRLAYTDKEECKNCGQPVISISKLMNVPNVIAIGVLWATNKESKPNIKKTFSIIQTILDISQLFNYMKKEIREENRRYNLESIICYHKHHYTSFVYKKPLNIWFECDDNSIYNIGDFNDLIILCVERKYQPLLLVYASENNIPLPPVFVPTQELIKNLKPPKRVVSARHRK